MSEPPGKWPVGTVAALPLLSFAQSTRTPGQRFRIPLLVAGRASQARDREGKCKMRNEKCKTLNEDGRLFPNLIASPSPQSPVPIPNSPSLRVKGLQHAPLGGGRKRRGGAAVGGQGL